MKVIPLLRAHTVGGTLRGPGWSGTPLSVTVSAQLIPGHCRALLSQCCSQSTCTRLLTERNMLKLALAHSRALYMQGRCSTSWSSANGSLPRKPPPAERLPPYLLHRALAAFHLLFLGDCWIPVTHQAVILDAVVLVTKKPVGFHFPFALG